MILRRVIAHFRRQEWTAIFLDFVTVVAGWAQCLRKRLDTASAPGPSCRGEVGVTADPDPVAEKTP